MKHSAVKAPAAVKAEPSQALVVKNGSSTQPKMETEAQEPEQAPAATSIATNTNNSALSGLVNTIRSQCHKSSPADAENFAGRFAGTDRQESSADLSSAGPADAAGRQSRTAGEYLQDRQTSSGIKQLSGDGILGRAAMDAVRQWKYKPYYLNGEPVEVETQITVNFKLP